MRHDELSQVRAALVEAGRPTAEPEFLAAGATCRAYRAGDVVVRLSDPHPGKVIRFSADARLRSTLLEAGVPVAQPIAHGTLPDGRAYSVDTLLEGEPAGEAGLSTAACQDLGRALAALHRLPCTGFGLLQDCSDALVGLADNPVAGLQTRLQDAWPFGSSPLEAHPLVQAAPDLAAPLQSHEAGLRSVIHTGAVVCHTDLHGEQFRLHAGRLTGLLDFGDAAIGPPAGDLASFAYFHGWARLDELLLSYGEHDDALLRQAHLFGLLLAFHRASRAVTLHRPVRLQASVEFARTTLDLLA